MSHSDTFNSQRNGGRSSWSPKVLTCPVAEPRVSAPVGEVGEVTDKYAALLQCTADLIFVLRRGGEIVEFHGPRDNEFLLSADALVGHRVMELLPSQAGQMAVHYLEKTLRTQQPQIFSFHYALPGRLRIFETRTAVCGPDLVLAMVRDNTDRELLEKEIVEGSNRVQTRIGQDLHDGLGQHLTGITFLTKALERKLTARELPEAAEAAEIGQLVMGALSQTRNLARGLFPAEVESDGLVAGLRQLVASTEETCRVSCELEYDERTTIGNPTMAMHLFRLAQEGIHNAVTHGKAKRITLRLASADDQGMLSIIDDGVGMPPQQTRPHGLGLRIMAYRAQKVGGVLQIQAGEHGGTCVSCSFPLNIEQG